MTAVMPLVVSDNGNVADKSKREGFIDRVQSDSVSGQSANLDFLRSFAVGCVLVDHLFRTPGNMAKLDQLGRFGVLLFFVHTAFVLLQSLSRLHADGRGRAVSRFFTQRIFRIYPLYLAAMAFAFFWRIPEGGVFSIARPETVWQGWSWFLANLALVQNLTGDGSVSQPMWSLPYEMQMYLALPLVYVITRQENRLLKLGLISLAAVVIAVFMIARLHDWRGMIVFFVPCFMGGAYAFCLPRRPVVPAILLPVLLVVLAVLYCAWPAAIAQWAAPTLLGFALPSFAEIRTEEIRRASAAIAKYSYGIYLWHWPLLWLCFRRFDMPMAARFLAFIVALWLLSYASYHLIEAPMIRIGRSFRFASSTRIPELAVR